MRDAHIRQNLEMMTHCNPGANRTPPPPPCAQPVVGRRLLQPAMVFGSGSDNPSVLHDVRPCLAFFSL